MKLKRAALYTRVSSEEQNTEAQEHALREYVRRRGWIAQKIYLIETPRIDCAALIRGFG